MTTLRFVAPLPAHEFTLDTISHVCDGRRGAKLQLIVCLCLCAGSRSLISNAIVGAIVLIVISFLSSIFYYVPMAALAAAITSAIRNSIKVQRGYA